VLTLLELSDEEARALRVALEEHLHTLRTELASTETRQFKALLRHTLDVLEPVAARLGVGQPAGANAVTP
jgi:(p)ppGpp synthase/HD superfamily hydrolase